MAEFKLGRIRFVWKGDWTASTTYYQDDVVSVGGKTYICTIGHSSSADFYSDFDIVPPKWNLVADGQAWRGNWSPNTEYIYNDIVKYGSGLYICNTIHTSANTTGTGSYTVTVDTNAQSPFNNVFVLDGTQYPKLQFIAGYTYTFNQDDASNDTHPLLFSETQHGIHNGGTEYTTGVTYYLDGSAVADSTAYVAGFDAATTREVRIAVTGATPDPLYYYCANHNNMAVDADIDISLVGLETDAEKWDTFGEGLSWKGDWTTSFGYKLNDIVKYGGTTYVCNTAHTSANSLSLGLENDQSKWDYLNQGLDYKSQWVTGTRYKVNDVVRYGASLWISTASHTAATSFGSDSANWEKFVEGFQYEGEWDAYADYQPGDIVQYGGYQYIAKTDHSGEFPSTSTANWDLFTEGFRFLDDWAADSSNQDYRVGDVVRYGGYTYICIQDHNNQEPPNATYWKKFTSGLNWRGAWLDDQQYFDGDIVRYGDNSYICILGHISEGDDYSSLGGAQNSRPDLDLTGTYWQVVAVGTEQSVLTTKGDLVYYSGSAPARLPIGQDGQILTVNAEGLPNWEFIGDTDDVYYVAGHGKDNPAPIYGKTIDRPWKSIRYATQQIERGTKNPNAAKLLEINRRFIQREIVEWTDYQIANAGVGSMWENLDYDSSMCERDMGYIVDALIWDIKHGGNEYSWDAAYSYVDTGSALYTLGQEDQTIASINYGLSVIENVLNQTAPSVNYQTTNGDNSTAVVAQWFDANISAEDVISHITENVGIITDTIAEGNERSMPKKLVPTTLVKVSTGYYNEVLPIIVPAECCIMGDELRATNVQPRKQGNGTLTPRKDVPFSFKALERMEEIVGDIVEGVAVTATSGNVELQDQTWPYAETDVVGPQVQKLARTVRRQIDSSIGDKIEAIYTPAYELSDANYGYSRDLFLLNKPFIKAEIEAYLADQYPDLMYSKTRCLKDVGLILDAVAYDLTYGGNWMSVETGKAYFNGASGNLQIDSAEKAATLASYAYLKELMQTTGRNITVNPTYQTPSTNGDVSTVPVPQVAGTGGSIAVSTTIGDLMDDIITTIDLGYASAPAITYPTISTDSDAYVLQTAVNADKSTIQTGTIDFISKNFGSFRYNSAICRRDLTNIITDIAYDVALGTNYNGVFSGLAYQRPTNAYNLTGQRKETIGALRYARDQLQADITDATAEARSDAAFNEIVDIIENGSAAADTLSYPVPSSLPTANADDAFNNLEANKAFIEAEITAWIDDQVLENTTTNPDPNSIWFNFTYNSTKCARDVGFIVEAMKYDILYGGTMSTTRIAESYFGIYGDSYPADQTAQTAAAYDRLATVLDQIAREVLVTTSSGNAETQTQSGSPATSTEGNILLANMQIIEDVLTAGNTNSMPAATYPNLASLGVSATLQTEKTAIDNAKAQTILDVVQYISDTYNDFNYNHAKCSRDVGLIIDAAVYDYAMNTNFAGMFAAHSYLRAPSSNVVSDQKTASIAAFEYAKVQVLNAIDGNATAKGINAINNTWDWIDDTIFNATPEGSNKGVADQEVWNAIRMIELNKDFMVSEVQKYVDEWFTVGVSNSTAGTNELTVSDTTWMEQNQAIRFVNLDDSADAITNAGLASGTTYYVKDITSDTTLTISATPGGTAVSLTGEDFITSDVDTGKLRVDIEEIVEGVVYDSYFNTNYNAVTLGLDFVTGDNATQTSNASTEILAGISKAKAETAALKAIRTGNSGTWLTRANAAFDEVTDIVTNGSGNANAYSYTGLTNAALQVRANNSFIVGEVLEWLNQNYNAIYTTMDTAQFTTEIGYVVEALAYDLTYGGNSASWRLANRYFVGNAFISNLDNNRTAGNLAFNYLQSFIDNIVLDDSASWTQLSGGLQDTSNAAGSAADATKAQTLVGIFESAAGSGNNSSFPSKTYPTSNIGAAGIDKIAPALDKAKLIANRTVRYVDKTYSSMFSLEADYDYNLQLCTRDLNEIIFGMKWDLNYPQQWKRAYTDSITLYRPGCYRTKLAARWYVNAVLGSQEEDFYYMRNGTGLRLQTLDGLKGDLGPANAYGTRRPTAGAYSSLDPGWGPNDTRVWITSRSPYMQNCTCFGYGAIGQKIDGALHNGGNDSMVSNDFTQLISDGIGAWVTNNGRAELVSVFTYYSHVGYLAENGGRIRATNGNNSYGTFGSVAEGTDPEETPVTGVVDNKFQYNATIAIVNTDADELLNVEFNHAGNEYTEAEIEFFGPGDNEIVLSDEFRDGATYQVQVDETPNVTQGGTGYLNVSNTAQVGSATGLTISATDGNISTAYPGMRVQITGGAGVGLYGIIDTYNAGSKALTVIRESDGAAGWDHVVPGWPWEAPNSTSTYEIEAYVDFTAPAKTSGASTLPTTTTWHANKWIQTAGEYTNVASETESDGFGATFDVIRNGSKYYVTINAAGSDYLRLDTVTIKGSNLDGVDTTHDITVTITSLDANGGIVDFDFTGHGRAGFFLAVGDSSNGAKSYDGINWTAQNVTAPSAGNWSDIATGLLDDGSTTFHPMGTIIVADGSGSIVRTSDGDTWTAGSLPGALSSAGENSIAFGNVSSGVNRFVVISDADQDIAYSDDGGQNWTLQSSALSAIGFDSITYGKGLYVAARTGTTSVAYSDNGVVWQDTTLPGTIAGNVTWGNGRFVVIGGTNGVMYSLDGVNWYNPTIPGAGNLTLPLTATERQVAYGQGVFVITSDDTDEIQYSEDGLYWQAYTLTGGAVTGGFNAVAFGNPEKAGVFSILPNASGTGARYANIGATTKARAGIANEQIFEFRIYEPGSGYTSAPTITITDPNNIEDVTPVVRIGNGALANPTFIHRGSGYTSSTASLNVLASNGSADFNQYGAYIAVRQLTSRPVPGSNVIFDSLPGQFFKLVSTVSFIGSNDGSYTAFLQISPSMTVTDAPVDGDPVTMRIRFSQVRLTGHDFLDIGTGNFVDTNYPGVPVNDPVQSNETVDSDGGRVFYTATDQDGNFRVGDLFQVEQATGVATLNAEAFNIAGLQELTLGEVTLGGNSASITEFSTDPFFTANSDTIVPTQRAIKAYIESQIGGGGATLVVNSVTAGDIFIGGTQITTVSGSPINIRANVVFSGTVLGYPLAWNYFQR